MQGKCLTRFHCSSRPQAGRPFSIMGDDLLRAAKVYKELVTFYVTVLSVSDSENHRIVYPAAVTGSPDAE